MEMGEQLFRFTYPPAPQIREPALQAEQRLVAGQQIGASPPSQFEKFLVVGVAAKWQLHRIRCFSHTDIRYGFTIITHYNFLRGYIEGKHRISQYPLEFGGASLVCQRAYLAIAQGGSETGNALIAKSQQIQGNVGIKDDPAPARY